MKPQELRIDNLVSHKGKLHLVSKVLGNIVCLRDNDCVATKSLKGVALTEQSLMANGFVKFGEYEIYNREFDNWTYSIQRDPNDKDGYIFFIDIDGVAAPPSVYVKHWHKVQNLIYELTGKPLPLQP